MHTYKTLGTAAAIAALLPFSATQAALISYNTTANLSGLGRSADGSGSDPFAGGANYASAGNPSYSGNLPASWYTVLNGVDSATINSAELPASAHMGVKGVSVPELTVGGHAYQDVTQNAITSNGVTTGYTLSPTNWGHNSDFGLFHLNAAADVTISVSADNNSQLSPGFSVWQGWDSSSTSTRHGLWLNNGAPLLNPGKPAPLKSNLGAFEGTAYTSDINGTATLTLHDLPAGNYTVVIGGYFSETCVGLTCTTVGGKGGFNAEYSTTFTSDTPFFALPIPGSAWLFASAVSMFWLKRNQKA